MNKTISIIRVVIITVMFCCGLIFLFGEEHDENACAFLLHVIVDKSIAIGLFYYIGRIYKHWIKVDEWFNAYEKKSDDVMDAPNPCYLGED